MTLNPLDNPFLDMAKRAEMIITHFYDALWQIEMVIRVPDPALNDQQRLEKIMGIIEDARKNRP